MTYSIPNLWRLKELIFSVFFLLLASASLSAQCTAAAGELSLPDGGDIFFICVDDGESDLLTPVISGEVSGNTQFLLTTAAGFIVERPSGPSFEFEGFGAGVNFLYQIAIGDGFSGSLGIGDNICELTEASGCFDLSNSITVNRRTGAGCADICDAMSSGIALTDGSVSTSICADGIPDPLDIVMSGDFVGEENTFVITDLDGTILGLPGDAGPIDLDPAGPGTCVIWYIVYNGGLNGLATAQNLDDLDGCFDLSNGITVVRNASEGGAIALEDGSTETSICTTDGVDEPIAVVRDGNASGANTTFLITDQATGEILGIPGNNGPFTIDGAGAGTCEIWYLAYADGLEGLVMGNNVADLAGCFDLSNPVAVDRRASEGGAIALEDGSTATSICTTDGVDEPIAVVRDGNASGANTTFLITDQATGEILGIPGNNGPFTIDGAGAGTCEIWYLAYADGLEGLVMGNNVADLAGCFDLSNPVAVDRRASEGGAIALEDGSTATSICTTDGVDEPIAVVRDGNASGANTTFLITDQATGEILGIPGNNGPFTIDGAGAGTCEIWYLAYADGLEGLVMGNNVADLAGCFDLSNPVAVDRRASEGGAIALEDGSTATSICTTDGVDEPITVVRDGNASGANTTFLITDQATGEILGIPGNNGPFTIDGAGAGTCEIWYLAYADGLEGLAMGNNVADLAGCFDLSNPVAVDRTDDCGDGLNLENVIINEIGVDGRIELYNPTGAIVDVSSFWLCDLPVYNQLSELTIECGSLMMQPGDYLVVSGFTNFNPVDAELGLYTTNSFGSSAAIISYIRYGGVGGGRSDVAVAAGIWPDGGTAENPTDSESLQTFTTGGALSWSLAPETFCEENSLDGFVGGSIIISEVGFSGEVELENRTDGTLDLSNLLLVSGDEEVVLSSLVINCGNAVLQPGDVLVVDANELLTGTADELALYTASNNILSYLAYGQSGQPNADVAIAAGLWTEGQSETAPTTEATLQVFAADTEELTYRNLPSSLCKQNDQAVSTGNVELLTGVTIFPNPVEDVLNLKLDALTGQQTTVQIMDLNGRRVLEQTLNLTTGTTPVRLPEGASGTYFLRVINDGKVATLRFVKL